MPKANKKSLVEKMSTIIEDIESDDYKISSSETKKSSTESKTPITRKKRKFYSPKDDQITFDEPYNESKTKVDENDTTIAKVKERKLATSKFMASCHKYIEKEHKTALTRKAKNVESPPSPTTTKNDEVFEYLKDSIETHENNKIILADKKWYKEVAIYNVSSDSEDEDLKPKKLEIHKLISIITKDSGTSVIFTPRGRVISKMNYKDDDKESTNGTANKAERKRVLRRNASEKASFQKEKVYRPENLVDEKMREASPEELNTPFVFSDVNKNVNYDKPMIQVPALEVPENLVDEKMREASPEELNTSSVFSNVNINVNYDKPMIQVPALEVPENLVDEKMREAGPEELNTSFAFSNVNKNVNYDKPMIQVPALEIISDKNTDIVVGDGKVKDFKREKCFENQVEDKTEKYKKSEKKQQKSTQKSGKAYHKNEDNNLKNATKDDEGTISPLPELVIETELEKNEVEDSFTTNMTTKFAKIYKDDLEAYNDTITTQNMLSDSEIGISFPNFNITDVFKMFDLSSASSYSVKEESTKTIITTKEEEQNVIRNSQRSRKSIKSHCDQIDYDDIIGIESEIVTESNESNIKSISTDGITAHGDMNEMAPSPKHLAERLTPREISDMDDNLKNYFFELSNKVNNCTDATETQANNKKDSDKKEKIPEKSDESPKLKTKNLDDFMLKRKQQENTSRNKDDTVESQDEDIADKSDYILKKYFGKPTKQSSPISKRKGEETKESTPKRASKRSGPVCNGDKFKRKKFEERGVESIDLTDIRSSNVEEWLTASSGDALDTTDIVQNVLEKLNITLPEIHQDTTKNFIMLFVEVQEKLINMKAERRRMMQAANILLNDMEQRAEEQENELMDQLKTRAAQVLRTDEQKKKALVAILRDEVEAVAEQLARTQQ